MSHRAKRHRISDLPRVTCRFRQYTALSSRIHSPDGMACHMTREAFIATAWNNGCPKGSGAGHGLKIPIADRDRFFKQGWQTVTLRLIAGETPRIAEVNCVKESLWNDTRIVNWS